MAEHIDALLATARAHGLDLAREQARVDESGADYTVAHAVDGDGVPWIVRVPRRPDVAERAGIEHRALEMVRMRIPAGVPRWEVFSPELIAYRRLAGHPAAVVDAEAGGYVWRFDETHPPTAFLDSLAAVLAALHGVEPAEALAAGLPVRTPADVRQEHAARMERARDVLQVPDSVWRRWQAWLADVDCWPEWSTLIHGDLHPAHILVDDAHRVTGLLDWTEARVADPAADFAVQYATLGRAALDALVERYGRAGGRVWPRMADHVVETWSAYPAVIAQFALLTGDDGPRQLGQYLVDANATELAGQSAR
jgi:macrolide phosphotransferase